VAPSRLSSAALAFALALGAARVHAARPVAPPETEGVPVESNDSKAAVNAPDCLLSDRTLERRTVNSSRCTTCHPGGTASVGHAGHPCDVPYSTYGRDLRLDPERFNAAVVLAAGKITCLTCHDPRSGLAQHLAAPTGGEVALRLCVACHPH
jgi:hypothetical protein